MHARSPVLVAHSTLHKPLTMRLLTSPPKDVRETDGKSNGGGERKKKNLRWRPFENRKPRSHVCVESLFLEGDSQLVLHLVLSQPCLLCLFLVLSPIYLYIYIHTFIYLRLSVFLLSSCMLPMSTASLFGLSSSSFFRSSVCDFFSSYPLPPRPPSVRLLSTFLTSINVRRIIRILTSINHS